MITDTFVCIVDSNLNVLTGRTKNHRDIIKRHQLEDDKIRNRNFVRVKVLRINNNMVSFGFDDEHTLPEWFKENYPLIEKKCLYYAVKEWNAK
jgi:hypothetical protein